MSTMPSLQCRGCRRWFYELPPSGYCDGCANESDEHDEDAGAAPARERPQ